MAFKSFAQYQEDKNGEFFVLPNHGDSADVVFLYKNIEQVLVADVHYISSPGYKGYVHCCGNGCPACNYVPANGKYRGLRLDHKIFIPLYNIQKNKIEFWDRSTFFESVLHTEVFSKFPNPSEVVFRITRNGQAGSRETTYDITPVGRNTLSYEQILATFNTTFPEGYSVICKEMSPDDITKALSANNTPSDLTDYGYTPVPRGTAPVEAVTTPEINVPVPEYSAQPDMAPPLADYPVATPAPQPEYAPPFETAEDAIVSSDNAEASDDSADQLDDVKF